MQKIKSSNCHFHTRPDSISKFSGQRDLQTEEVRLLPKAQMKLPQQEVSGYHDDPQGKKRLTFNCENYRNRYGTNFKSKLLFSKWFAEFSMNIFQAEFQRWCSFQEPFLFVSRNFFSKRNLHQFLWGEGGGKHRCQALHL